MRGYVDTGAYWTHGSSVEFEAGLRTQLTLHGYEFLADEADIHWYQHRGRPQSVWSSSPYFMGYGLLTDSAERTCVQVHMGFGSKTRVLSTFVRVIALATMWFIWRAQARMMVEPSPENMSQLFLTMISLALYQTLFFHGFPGTFRRIARSRSLVHGILRLAAAPYPVHVTQQTRKPLGVTSGQETLLLAGTIIAGLIFGLSGDHRVILTLLFGAFMLVIVALSAVGQAAKQEAPLTTERRNALAACSVTYLTALLLTLGPQLVGWFGTAMVTRAIAACIAGRSTIVNANLVLPYVDYLVFVALGAIVASVTTACYTVHYYVAERDRTIDAVARSGEFEEHVGHGLRVRDGLVLGTLVAALSFGMWASAYLAVQHLLHLASGHFHSLTGLPERDWENASAIGLHLPVLILFSQTAGAVLTVAVMFTKALVIRGSVAPTQRSTRTRLLTDRFADLVTHPLINCKKPVHVVVTQVSGVLAYSRIGCLQSRASIILSSGLLDALPGDSCRFVVAHELAHITLRHHPRLRTLRLLSLILLFDPGSLTAFLNSPAMEEAADELAWRVLGADQRALDVAEQCLMLLDVQWNPGASEAGTWLASARSGRFPARTLGPWSNMASGLRALLGMEHVLYEHPSAHARIRRLRSLHSAQRGTPE